MKVPVGLAFLFVATITVLPAQEAQQDPPVFKGGSDLVVLHVNVFDGKSDAVPNLPETAFQISEDDTPQKITFFSNEDVPVTAGLIVDNSGSMITRRSMVMTGTKIFAESSHPEDELFTIVFNEHVRHGLPPSLPFTRSRVQIQTAMLSGKPSSSRSSLRVFQERAL